MTLTLDQLKERVHNASVNLALGLIAGGAGSDILPVAEIAVEKTADGVVVKFIAKPKRKIATKADKSG